MLKRFLTAKPVVIGAYLALGMFLLTHRVNASVADALPAPLAQSSAFLSIIPPEPRADSRRALVDTLVINGLFPVPPNGSDTPASSQAAHPVSTPLEVAKKVALIGTVIGTKDGIMVILEDISTKKQSLYHVGDQILGVGTLSAIEKSRALFRAGQQEEWLPLALTQQLLTHASAAAPAPAPRHSHPQRRILDRREIDAALSDTTRLLTHAQAIPYLTDGKLDGFRLYSVMPLGFFDKIGLQTNDLLQRVNGVEIRDPNILLALFQQLRNERTVQVDIVRNAQRQTLTYETR